MKAQTILRLWVLILISPPALAGGEMYSCFPTHWVNLRATGPDINSGNEPTFILELTPEAISITGKDSWLDDSTFHIKEELSLGTNVIIKGASTWSSQFVFNKTTGHFFHTSAHPGVAVSMVGSCR